MDLILLDFSKAFGKVRHSKLLLKQHSCRIKKNMLRWIPVFLSNCWQKVVVEGKESDPVPITSGVPPDSVLGPILFLVYINDFRKDIISQVRLFAVDTAIHLTLDDKGDSEILQKYLDS